MAKSNSKKSGLPAIFDPVVELIAESLEVFADARVGEGLLKELPVAGSVIKGFKIFSGIKDHILIRKIHRFLVELKSVPVENRTKFWATYQDSEEEKRKLGEQLIVYLDRHDTIDKAALLARAFGAYISGQVQKADFLDLAVYIDSLQVHRLEEIVSILVLAGDSSSFYSQISVVRDWGRYIPELEVRRLLDYEDETKMVEDRYKGPVIKTERKHKSTALGQYFLDFVVPELYEKVSNDISEFYAARNQRHRQRIAEEMAAITRVNSEGSSH